MKHEILLKWLCSSPIDHDSPWSFVNGFFGFTYALKEWSLFFLVLVVNNQIFIVKRMKEYKCIQKKSSQKKEET